MTSREKLRDAIIEWHNKLEADGHECAAHNEGLYCCVDPHTEKPHLTGAYLERLLDAIEAVVTDE